MAMSLPHKATIVASVTAFLLAIAKFAVGIATGSMAVLASAIDSLLDMLMSLFNLYAVKNSEKEADELFNYGRGKIEGLASLLEGTLIGFSGLFIIYQSGVNLIEAREIESLDTALWVMIVSTIVTAALVLFLAHVGKKTNSLVVRADTLHYRSDLYTNVGIIVSLGVIFLTQWHWVDAVVSIAIAAFIIASAYKIANEGVMMLLDRALEPELLEQIRQVIEAAPKVQSYHYLRTRRSANTNLVDVHLVFNEAILLKDAHVISDWVEDRIRLLDEQARWLITVHLDPKDDSKQEEI